MTLLLAHLWPAALAFGGVVLISLCLYLSVLDPTPSIHVLVSVLVLGVLLCCAALALWLSASRRSCRKRPKERDPNNNRLTLLSVMNMVALDKDKRKELSADATENLMKSIKGIPYLIQAIQYSLETNLMTEMGQSMMGTSVIHTAPGCTSVLDCAEHCAEMSAANSQSASRLFTPDEQWQNVEASKWTNQQLKLSLNQQNDSLVVFPYSESQPLTDLTEDNPELLVVEQGEPFHGSAQSNLSRVTVAYNSANQQEVRCIGMTSAFLSRFNDSFKT